MKTEGFKENSETTALDEVPAGHTVRIVRVDSGHCLNNRLASMGLLKDTEITVIRNDGAGQIIVAVKSSKIILGRGMSQKIFVAHI
ncbi:MAG: ferrous iron transport protein A [Phycisphaerae bacterium]|nr:ferrous iron transport protein A [Phycisphaerae bacterium]